MRSFFVKLISCFIPNKQWRKNFRNRFLRNYTKKRKLSERLDHMEKLIESMAFKQSIFLNHYVDIKNVIPARAGMRQIQMKRLKTLELIADILEKHSIGYWLDGGTLLGAVRHNSFIPWDNDIDIGIWEKDKDKCLDILKQELKLSNKYKLVDASELRNFPEDCFFKIIGKDDNYEYLDIFCFGEKPDNNNNVYKLWWAISNTNPKYIQKPSYHFDKNVLFPLSKIEFEGRLYLSPNNPEKYVELQYGNYQIFPDFPYEPVILKEVKLKYSEDLERELHE